MTMKLLLVGIAATVLALAGCQSTKTGMDDMDDMDDMSEVTEMDDMKETDDMDESMESMESMDSMEGTDDSMAAMTVGEFTVTIEVLPGSTTPIAPVAWAVHNGANPFLTADMGRLEGLEALAEDGDPGRVAATLSRLDTVVSHGVANTPDMASGPGPAGPGHSYSFTVKAEAGQYLSFATMYVQSNDLFFSPGEMGLALYEMEMAVHGAVTSHVHLYDAGTEMNQAPGTGRDQAPRQTGPNTGMAEDKPVMAIADVMDGYAYPPVESVIKVTVEPVTMM